MSHLLGIYQVGEAEYQPAPGIPCLSFPALEFQVHAIIFDMIFFTWLLGTKFRSFFSKGKHFTHGVDSFALFILKLLTLKLLIRRKQLLFFLKDKLLLHWFSQNNCLPL